MRALYLKCKQSGLTRGELRSKKTSMKAVAAEVAAKAKAQAAAVEAAKAAKAEAAALVDLAFISKFAKKLDAVEIEKLDRPQSETLVTDLDVLRLAVKRKLKTLKDLGFTAKGAVTAILS
jgi:hypothetical protein